MTKPLSPFLTNSHGVWLYLGILKWNTLWMLYYSDQALWIQEKKKSSLRNLHIAYKMWQTVFSKSRFYLKKNISLPTCSPKLPHHSPIKTWYLFLFSWIWDGPSSLWPTQYVKSNIWIMRVGHQKDISFCLVLLGHALWGKIATMYEVQLPWDEHTGEATRKR